MPSSLSLYNYKLSGVTDGPLSFSKAMSEVEEVRKSESMELLRFSACCEVLHEDPACAGLLNVDDSQSSFDQMQGVTVTEADSNLLEENIQLKDKVKKMQEQLDLLTTSVRAVRDLE